MVTVGNATLISACISCQFYIADFLSPVTLPRFSSEFIWALTPVVKAAEKYHLNWCQIAEVSFEPFRPAKYSQWSKENKSIKGTIDIMVNSNRYGTKL